MSHLSGGREAEAVMGGKLTEDSLREVGAILAERGVESGGGEKSREELVGEVNGRRGEEGEGTEGGLAEEP